MPVNTYVDSTKTKPTTGIAVKLSSDDLEKVLQIAGEEL